MQCDAVGQGSGRRVHAQHTGRAHLSLSTAGSAAGAERGLQAAGWPAAGCSCHGLSQVDAHESTYGVRDCLQCIAREICRQCKKRGACGPLRPPTCPQLLPCGCSCAAALLLGHIQEHPAAPEVWLTAASCCVGAAASPRHPTTSSLCGRVRGRHASVSGSGARAHASLASEGELEAATHMCAVST